MYFIKKKNNEKVKLYFYEVSTCRFQRAKKRQNDFQVILC